MIILKRKNKLIILFFIFIFSFIFSFSVYGKSVVYYHEGDPNPISRNDLEPGKSYDECSDLVKAKRRWVSYNVSIKKWCNAFEKALDFRSKNTSGSFEGIIETFASFDKIEHWCVQYGYDPTKFLNEQLGIPRDILDDVDKLFEPLPEGTEITIGPEFLNYIQDCINKINDGDKIRLYTRTPYTRVDWTFANTDNDVYSSAMPDVTMRYLSSMLSEHGFIWVEKRGSHGGDPAHSLRCCWLEGNLNEYCLYIGNIFNQGYGDVCNVYVKRVDGKPVTYHYQYFAYPSLQDVSFHSSLVNNYEIGTVTEQPGQTFCVGQGQLSNAPVDGVELCAIKHLYGGYQGIISTSGMFTIYNDLGAAMAASLYGGTIPEIIQPSYKNTYHDESYTHIVGDKSYNTYNYDYIVNEIGDPTGMSDQEIQNKIDEIMKTLQNSIETGNKIDEEGFNNFNAISSNNNELLNRILCELREIKHAIEDIEIDTGGGFLDTLTNLATGISSIINLLKDIFVDGVKDVGTDIVDIGEDIVSDVAIGALLEEINLKLDGILTELGFLVADEIAEDTAELIGDSLDFGSTIGTELTKKFPLSIPWDIALIIDCLSSPPATPVFELPLSIPSYGIDETITVDLSDFQLLSDVARWFFDVLFGLAITKLTMKILEIDLVHT